MTVKGGRLGLKDGLRIEHCSYKGESESAAIKRLLFQRMLLEAVAIGIEKQEFLDAIAQPRLDVELFVYAGTMLVHAPGEPGKPIDEGQPIEPKWQGAA